jgi:hypothetical protein
MYSSPVTDHPEQHRTQSLVPRHGKITFFVAPVAGYASLGSQFAQFQKLAAVRPSEVPCD